MRARRAGPVGAVRNCTEIFSGSRRASPEPDPPDWFLHACQVSSVIACLRRGAVGLRRFDSAQESAGRLIDLAHEHEKGGNERRFAIDARRAGLAWRGK